MQRSVNGAVFKRGTSLSKVSGVINRFSEDINLCLVLTFMAEAEHWMNAA
ncbi:putative nucleotidyltransferase component of viral defense system [Hydrogenophaga palleronii]|uniref:Nucleotidyltransferase component of viral defense system n=1 Tax=Hydrogenophaga palleronii TaxID=65655 RepID=A0ABU1WK21_9BURK|nr:nucleotidyl transferase AbiEii/AbiGii toxin family protein [Hydrogenophaga palleronii]MDR7149622.1 putative nucleotidyltransferase component of viral defense system [Hydrogenophaga palleronii]